MYRCRNIAHGSSFNMSELITRQAAQPGYLDGQDDGRYLNVSGVATWYTTYGCQDSGLTPVLFLHGGTGNVSASPSSCFARSVLLTVQGNQMFNQANAIAKSRMVIVQEWVGLTLTQIGRG